VCGKNRESGLEGPSGSFRRHNSNRMHVCRSVPSPPDLTGGEGIRFLGIRYLYLLQGRREARSYAACRPSPSLTAFRSTLRKPCVRPSIILDQTPRSSASWRKSPGNESGGFGWENSLANEKYCGRKFVFDFSDIGLGIDQILTEDIDPPDLFTDKAFRHLRHCQRNLSRKPFIPCPVAGCLGLDCSRPLWYR
jgi:hypothetical protein